MVVLVKCWVKCTYLLSLLVLYISPKMCTCIIITIPNFRGNLCNKYSLSIYFCYILCLFFHMQYESCWVIKYNHLQLDICPSAVDVPFGTPFPVLTGAAAIYLGSLKEWFVWNNLCLNLLSISCECPWPKKRREDGKMVLTLHADAWHRMRRTDGCTKLRSLRWAVRPFPDSPAEQVVTPAEHL